MTFERDESGVRIGMTAVDHTYLLLVLCEVKGFTTARLSDWPQARIEGEAVTLSLTIDEFESLLFKLGLAAGKFSGTTAFWPLVEFVNQMNRENPNFTRYEIPVSKEPPASYDIDGTEK